MPEFNNKTEIDKIYAQLSPRANKLYHFINSYYEYMNEPRDYDGSGEYMSMVEIHILTLIADQPGITVSQLAKDWGTTKGAISQTIKKLENKELICREKKEGNAKTIHIYATENGEKLSTAHKLYDNADILQTQYELLKTCTSDELNTFYKVVQEYSKLFD
ncbi:MAG: MarR family winged helix-turn-helix transcriptional regulator [Sedimentibacter sp.]